ncbi:hypothetical protein [Saccharopolyspora hattusasensis]|uniref:hypothetical protein n=1 Tax=Saccharopolyspora hattusasensis TaxID=1128679 RepID=UPI003D97257D
MELFGWLFGTREVPGKAQAAFDHPKIYGEVETGPGVAAASRAAANWRERVSATFGEADADLDQVLKKFDVVMEGAAGDQAKEAVTPLAQDTRQSVEVAAQVGAAIEQQAQGSADFKNRFPPPHQVPPDNIGWTDYVNPISYGTKTGVRAAHEEIHAKVDTEAREQYTSYTQASNGRVNTVQHFDPPPRFDADVTPAATTPVSKVDQPTTGYTSTSTTPSGQAQVPHASTTSSPATPSPAGHASANPVAPTPAAPAGSGSAWATPPSAGGGPLPGTAALTPAPGGGGFGAAVIPPGGSGTGTSAPGGRPGTGVGTGTGRGVTPGPGAGIRGGGPGAGSLGGGGRSGTGVPGVGNATTAGGTAARGGPGGRGPGGAAGAAGCGRGQGEEDKEHENKYVEETSELFDDLGLPKTAPPVFGDWGNELGLPPRPPEKK